MSTMCKITNCYRIDPFWTLFFCFHSGKRSLDSAIWNPSAYPFSTPRACPLCPLWIPNVDRDGKLWRKDSFAHLLDAWRWEQSNGDLSQHAGPRRGEKLGTAGLREAIVHRLHFVWATPFVSHHGDYISVAANLRTGSRQRWMRNLNPLWNVGRFWGLRPGCRGSRLRSQEPRWSSVDH